MIETFLSGMIAGYGIAIPVGAIAILIIDVSVRHGFRNGFAAGAGAASADLLYATLAAGAGGLLAPIIAPAASMIGMLSGGVLLVIAVAGLRSLSQGQRRGDASAGSRQSAGATFARFIALTIVNPLTVVYFSALLLGSSLGELTTASLLVFIAGAFLASLSWQTLLAALGAWAHVSAGARFRRASGLVGNLVILGFALTTLLRSLP